MWSTLIEIICLRSKNVEGPVLCIKHTHLRGKNVGVHQPAGHKLT